MALRVTVRFHGSLNDFLPPERRGLEFEHTVNDRCSVKDLIEALGPPHPEVDVVLVDGQAVDFAHQVNDGQQVVAYPALVTLAVAPRMRVGPQALSEPRFLLDVGLGRLAGLLRMLGFDTLWRNDWADEALARLSHAERRILLTRDYGVLKRSEVEYGYFPRETDPPQQLVEVSRRYQLTATMRPFTRCIACNTLTGEATREEVRGRVPAEVHASFERFRQCPGCQRVFWAGSHHTRMLAVIDSLRAQERQP